MDRDASILARRPLVVVEDHVAHLDDLLAGLDRMDPAVSSSLVAVCLQRSGPDTQRSVAAWLQRYPTLKVATSVEMEKIPPNYRPRMIALGCEVFQNANDYCRRIASLIRPNGLLLQDIQLSTLRFLPAQRWWESIYLATTVRGMFAHRPPHCVFVSNKRGYEATFGAELIEAGFHPRDVMEKSDLGGIVVPALIAYLRQQFSLSLVLAGVDMNENPIRVGSDEAAKRAIENELDLVVWPGSDAGIQIGGRALLADEVRLQVRAGSPEAETWSHLLQHALDGGAGIPVVDLGRRLAPPGAARAEQTNAAARHIHVLRSRLVDRDAIITVDHNYRLARHLRLGLARASQEI